MKLISKALTVRLNVLLSLLSEYEISYAKTSISEGRRLINDMIGTTKMFNQEDFWVIINI